MKNNYLISCFAALLIFAVSIMPALGQLSITSTGTPFTIDFDSTVVGVNEGQFMGAGFSPTPGAGQINSNAFSIIGLQAGPINFGDLRDSETAALGVSSGGVTPGGIYAFTVASENNALGFQPTGNDLTPGDIILKITNNTGSTATITNISYDILFKNNEDRSTEVNFFYSGDDITYNPIPSLDFRSTELSDIDGPPFSWETMVKATSIDLSSTPIPNNGDIYLRWSTKDYSGSGNRDEIAIDNISVTLNPVYDNDSRIISAIQPPSTTISSTTDTEGEAIYVFRFGIEDLGTSDGKSTNVQTLRVVPGTNNIASWTEHIQGIRIDNGAFLDVESVDITDSYLDINFLEGAVSVPDNSTMPMRLRVYLNTSNIVDSSTLQFEIDSDAVGFSTFTSGSGFSSSFPEIISSELHTISVEATELRFINQPINANTFEAMATDVSVEATDENGNRDLDFTSIINLTSTGTMEGSPIPVAAVDGVATWVESTDPIIHTEGGTGLTLTASSVEPEDGDGVSDPFDITQTANQLEFTSYSIFGQRNLIVEPIVVSALLPDLTVDETFTGNITLAVNSGPGSISGTLVKAAVNGVATFDNILFNTNGIYTLSASGHVYMTPAISENIEIVPFFQGFFSCPAPGWVSVLISGNNWTCDTDYASVSGLGASSPTQAWYVSPVIDFSTLSDQVMMFDSWTSGTDISHPGIEVLYSTGYTGTGNPNLSTWNTLVFNLPAENSVVWVPSGTIDLSGITSSARIAFKYTSSGTTEGSATEWRIDNVAITENGCLAPTIQATNLVFENIQTTGMTLSWESGNGTGRIVLASIDPITGVPESDTDYTADAAYGTPGTELGSAFVVYKGNENTVTVTNLDPNTIYYFSVFEFNCNADDPAFNITDPASGSQITNASNIIAQPDYVYSELTDYATYAGLTNLTDPANSRGVFGLTIQDGGSTLMTDELPTILTSITFNTNGSNAVRAAVLFDDTNTFIAGKTINGIGEFTIDGFNYTVPDGTSRNFELRVTFQNGVVDNQQIVFTVVAAISDPSGTIFSDPDAGGAQSSSDGTDNTIRVVANELRFVQVPVQTIPVNQAFTIEVEAIDSRFSRDLDKTLTITKTAGTGNLTTVTGATLPTDPGTALWNDLNYNTEETGVVFTIHDGGALSIETEPLDAKYFFTIFTFTGAAGNEVTFSPDFQPANVIISDISRGSGISPTTWANAFNSSSWPNPNLPRTPGLDLNSYYEVTITASPGYDFDLTGIQLDHKSSNNGPANWEVRSSLNNFGSNIGGFFMANQDGTWSRNIVVDFGNTIENQTEVTLRLYAYNATHGGGTFAIDNLIIFGKSIDIQAPSFTDGYPQSDSTAVNGFDLIVNLDEAATVYYIVQDPEVVLSAPDLNQVLDGLNGDDEAADAADTIAVMAAGIDFYERVRGLSSDNSYDVYYVLYDSTNYSEVILQAGVRTSDTDTELIAATQPDAPYVISSVADTGDEAVNVFNFGITDFGTADGAPTNVTKLVFGQGTSNLVTDWTTTLAGASLYNITGASAISVSGVVVTATTLEIDLAPGALTIEDGTTAEIALYVWLTNTVTDNDVLEFTIGGVAGNETHETGSQFASALASLTSNAFSIDVVADRLAIVSYTEFLEDNNESISLEVQATDANGNLDEDEETDVSVILGQSIFDGTLDTDPGNPTPGLTQSLTSGSALWNNITYSFNDDFITLITTSATLIDDTTGIITIGTPSDLIVTTNLTLTENLSVNNVIITPTGNLTISQSVTLSVSGDFTVDGILNGQSGTVNFNGTDDALQTIEGTAEPVNFHNITVTNNGTGGVRAEIDIHLHNTLLLSEGAIFDADGNSDDKNFTLVSTPDYTANIGPMGNGAELRGEIVWQRSLRTGPQGWRYIGTPIKNQTLANFRDDVYIQGIAESYPNGWTNIATYSEPLGTQGQNGLDGWVDFTSAANPVLNGTGMKLWLWNIDYVTEAKIINKGLPIIGDGTDGTAGSGEEYEFNISFEPTSFDGGGWNFFANPYPGEIDWDLINRTDLSGEAVYIWNPNTQQYGTYSPELGGTSIGGVTQYIASGQGFFIKANSAGATLSFTEASKSSADGNSFLRKSDEPFPKLMVELIASDGQKDETAIAFADFATNGYDPQYDALKLAGGWVNLSSRLENDKLIAINAMGEKRGVQSVKLHIDPYVYGAYTMKFPVLESFDDHALIRLRDHYLDKTTFINKGSQYAFNIDQNNPETFGSDRFEIQFVEPAAFRFADKSAKAGQEFVMPVFADQLADVMSAFMTLSWDHEALTFLGIEDAGDASMSNFDLSGVENGKLVFSEEGTMPINLPDGSQLFSIRFMPNNGMTRAQLRFENAASRLRAIDNIDMPFTSKDVLISILQNRFVAGEIATFSGEFVHEANVMAGSVDEKIEQISGIDGAYKLNTYEQSNYTISASKTDSSPVKDAVTTLDIIRSRLHLLGKEKFSSPYQIIAADVNGSNSVTALDLVEMQKVVLGINTAFTSGLNWLIIPESYDLTNNPFVYQTSVDVALTDQDVHLNFVGVKVGDVDNSWVNPDASRQSGGLFVMSMEHINLQDEFIEIPVIVAESKEIRGYQFSITWDASALEYYDVENGDLPGFFNDNLAASGVLTTMWDEASGNTVKLQAGQTLFTLRFRAGTESAASEVAINSAVTLAIAFDSHLQAMSVNATPANVNLEKLRNGSLELFQNVPNPFDFSTQIDFKIIRSGIARFTIINTLGEIVYIHEQNYNPGTYSISWDRSQSLRSITPGIYLYRLESNGEEAVKKMLIK